MYTYEYGNMFARLWIFTQMMTRVKFCESVVVHNRSTSSNQFTRQQRGFLLVFSRRLRITTTILLASLHWLPVLI